MIPSRRRFLAGVAGFLAAPPIVRVSNLMPIKSFTQGPTLSDASLMRWDRDYFVEYVNRNWLKPYEGDKGIFIVPTYVEDWVSKLEVRQED